MVDVSDLKPEARVELATVFPRFPFYSEGREFKEKILSVASEIAKFHPEMGRAIRELLPKAEAESKSKFYGPFNSRSLLGAMLNNHTISINSPFAPSMWRAVIHARLAHLVSSAIAELELRKRASVDPEAQRLAKQLDALQKCENEIL